jgi:hypothetical protein
MTASEAINRTTNLLGTAIVALSGCAFVAEFFTEDEFTHKIDDGLLFLLGIGAIGWYTLGKNKYMRSIAPVLFVLAALLIKIIGLILESGDPADQGDEFGAIILFALSAGFIIWQYVSARRLATKAQEQQAVSSVLGD